MRMTPQSPGMGSRFRRIFSRSPSPLPTRPTRPTSTSVQTPLQGPADSRNASGILANALEKLEKLEKEDREMVREMLPADDFRIDTTIVELHTYASKLQQLWVKERWSWNYKGSQIYVSDLMDKAVQFLNKFKSVGDLVANVDPIHIGLPWAGLRAILEVCVPHDMKPASCLRADQQRGCFFTEYTTSRPG
jgi:hypothetical protein